MSSKLKNQTSKIKTKVSEVEVLKNQLVRALADYDNLQKRIEREREEITKLSNLGLLVRLLPVVDMFEEAQKHLGDSGLEIALGQFLSVLKEDGIEKIPVAKGDNFNENIHEAIEVIKTEDKLSVGKIAEVSLCGWKYTDGTIIRHAKVKVFKN